MDGDHSDSSGSTDPAKKFNPLQGNKLPKISQEKARLKKAKKQHTKNLYHETLSIPEKPRSEEVDEDQESSYDENPKFRTQDFRPNYYHDYVKPNIEGDLPALPNKDSMDIETGNMDSPGTPHHRPKSPLEAKNTFTPKKDQSQRSLSDGSGEGEKND
jgi:hypothetical protein